MGEVKIRVKLTNAIDAGLARRGQITPEEVRFVETDAVVDTGAVMSVVPASVCAELGLAIVGEIEAWVANDDPARDQPGRYGQTEPVSVEIAGQRTYDDMLVMGGVVLIGQTVLEKLDLVVDCRNQRVTPNPEHGSQRILAIR